MIAPSFKIVKEFENKLADFFGSKYAIAVDSCTHGIELCLRLHNVFTINCPRHTYISIPFLANKLNIELQWQDLDWIDYYYVTPNILDAAVLWKRNSYIQDTYMCVSFQYQKHLSLGRGGVILTDNLHHALTLKQMSYDGRHPDIPWREQNISTMGYHYYMTPETAGLGVSKIENAINTIPRQWTINDWPDVSKMEVFNKKI